MNTNRNYERVSAQHQDHLPVSRGVTHFSAAEPDSSEKSEQSTPSEKELLWRHYALHIDLYKEYLDLLLKFNVFYFAIIGGILSFFFSNTQKSMIRYSLLFPIVMSMFFAILAFYAAGRVKSVVKEVNTIRSKLGFDVSPDINFLTFLLRFCGVLFLIVYIGIIVIFIFVR